MDAPKRIYAWPHFDGWITGDWSANTYPDAAEAYILAAEHDRIVAEKDARIARLREALTRITWVLDDERGAMEAAALSYARATLKGDDNG